MAAFLIGWLGLIQSKLDRLDWICLSWQKKNDSTSCSLFTLTLLLTVAVMTADQKTVMDRNFFKVLYT